MDHDICDVDGLETAVDRQPLAAMMKSIAELDTHCSAVLAYSTAAVMVHLDRDGVIHATVLGGRAGFASPDGASHLAFDSRAARPVVGSEAALLFLVPGWRGQRHPSPSSDRATNWRKRIEAGRCPASI